MSRVVGLIVALAGVGAEIQGQERRSGTSAGEAPAVHGCCASEDVPALPATPVADGSITLDGVMAEAAWGKAGVAVSFTQFQPDEGEPATQRTEARVLYSDTALFVFMRAHDTSPSEIASQLTRRDEQSYSDLLGVAVDSFFDRRTAFQFAVNPAGVKQDVYRFDDTGEDTGWDPVWDVATARDGGGWSAEFRIPLSQLRFRDHEEQTWGINFVRHLARREELSVWAPTIMADGAIVSRYGELRELSGLDPPRRLEVLPYSLARLRRAPGEEADPFYRANDALGSGGVDLKYGLTSDITLDVTVNPDFGQVEADPAVINLTAFETFFPERRPFFVEGAGIFNFGLGSGPAPGSGEHLFYSRRIGRAPQGRADPLGGHADAADRTTILGASKLSGKTAGGWSIGALHALTAEERAAVAPREGDPFQTPVEPFTNQGVLRLQRDFGEGRSAVGLIGTTVNRDAEVADDLGLTSAAHTGGVDFRHRFGDDAWELAGYVLGSHVQGSADAIARTQRSPARYYQRPDAGHVSYDAGRTSLGGGAADVGISKFAGAWRVSTVFQTRTPGFEVNDLGYQRYADYLAFWTRGGYHRSTPQGPFRNWLVELGSWNWWNYDGNRTNSGGIVRTSFQLRNFWSGYGGMEQEMEAWSNDLLRGGPLFRTEGLTEIWGGFGSDDRKPIRLNVNVSTTVRPQSDSRYAGVSPRLTVRPSGRASFSLGVRLSRSVNDRQWVRRIDTDAPNYLFARIERTTTALTARVDYAFTPELSLQVYAQPFVGSGRYRDFKRVADPRAGRYADRFKAVEVVPENTRYLAELGGSRVSFGNPDFNFKQFRSNTVLRWSTRRGPSSSSSGRRAAITPTAPAGSTSIPTSAISSARGPTTSSWSSSVTGCRGSDARAVADPRSDCRCQPDPTSRRSTRLGARSPMREVELPRKRMNPLIS